MTEDGIGVPLRRREDRRFLTGRGRYVHDIAHHKPCSENRMTALDLHAQAHLGNMTGRAEVPPFWMFAEECDVLNWPQAHVP